MATLVPIPHPPGYPIIGNLFDVDPEAPFRAIKHFARQYGEIFSLTIFGRTVIILNTNALAQEACDETRFHKSMQSVLKEVRNLTGDALFTAFQGEENWGIAHRVLTPAFGPVNVLGMVDDMYDILSQLVLKWERFGSKHPIDPTSDFTRLAFDTIALCSMSYRVNSFYQLEVPPFIKAMSSFLLESGRRTKRNSLMQRMMSSANQQYEEDQQTMLRLAKEIVEERKANPNDRKDLLNAMLKGRDVQTGKGLTDENIMQQMITFLIAGHETTSGLLSFTMYMLLTNPDVYAKLQAEVDAVVGTERIQQEHIARLPYIVAVLRETLRHQSPIVGITVESDEDQVVGGKYLVPKRTPVNVLALNVHRDPAVWGDDVEEFRPERMLDGKFEALPPKAWLPFGNGSRGCIGRAFAWQEAIMALATLFQRFDFRLADEDYELQIRQTITIKPKDLRIYAIPRNRPFSAPTASRTPAKTSTSETVASTSGLGSAYGQSLKPMLVLYGGNTGSCEMFAQRLASAAPAHGFSATIGILDSITQKLPINIPVVIVTASFEGQPADNAGNFVKHVETASEKEFAGIRFAVFGCGNKEWAQTYQRIPTLIDSLLARKGGERLLERGESDAGGERFFDSFDEWEAKLWPSLSEVYGAVASTEAAIGLGITVSAPTVRASTLRQDDVRLGTVISNTVLTKPGAIEKRHIEFKLPEGMTYRPGDYLAVLPSNPSASVKRVLSHFNLTPEQSITISSSTPTTLPVNRPVNALDLFSGYVELAQPATRKNIEVLLRTARSATTESALKVLLDEYSTAVLERRLSVLNILEIYPDIAVSLSEFLEMLPSMRIRQYSISSSPLWNESHVTLTIGVLRDTSLVDSKELFQGVASTFLAGLHAGDRVQIAVRPSNAAFHLPADPKKPIVMFSSGSGIAPMRGFLQERAIQKASGRDVGAALLFYGCRSPDLDFLYADSDLKTWIAQGVVDVRPAFSRDTAKSEGCKFVQDRVWRDRADVIALFDQDAHFYTCGSTRVATGVKETCSRMIEATIALKGDFCELKTVDEVWIKKLHERYAADVFG